LGTFAHPQFRLLRADHRQTSRKTTYNIRYNKGSSDLPNSTIEMPQALLTVLKIHPLLTVDELPLLPLKYYSSAVKKQAFKAKPRPPSKYEWITLISLLTHRV